jgi:hypothetical protein
LNLHFFHDLTPRKARRALACAVLAFSVAHADAHAQTVEITPFGGYRVGGDFYELATGQPIDTDGAPSAGLLVNVEFGPRTDGLKIEGLFTRQDTRLDVRPSPLEPPIRVKVIVDHAQVGGIQEFGRGRARPFLSGLLGITRYAAPGDTEVRFSMGAGGGVKLFASEHFGLRLDGRAYVTFVDADVSGVCGGLGCVLGFDTSTVWQADFTAGAIFAF